ncbi:cytochrome P450 10-like [Saccostrea echinata]|uniref:cytochrome P450 10-like n=1 Tax=Saccostrea echinata TaxID=191078 RepID=UPI002A825901|nr:cytochrome P450 10-like [Saccostrea echinata]
MATKGTLFGGLFTKTLQAQKRVVSTSATNRQAIALTEIAPITGPFQKVLDNINRIKNPKSSHQEPNIQTSADTAKPFEKIPGPKGLPIIGTLLDYTKKDGYRFDKLFEAFTERSLQYGPVFKEQIANMTTVVITDPFEYNKVIRAEGKYPKRRVLDPWFVYREKNKMGQGLVNAQGSEWHKYRSATSKKMLKMKEVLDYCTSMDKVADDFITHLSNLRNQHNEVVGIEKECFKWAMESMGTFLFESRLGCFGPNPPTQALEFIEHLQGLFHYMQILLYSFPIYKMIPTKPWKKYENHCDNVFRIGRSYIDRKAAEIQKNPTKDGEKSSFIEYMINQESLSEREALSTCVDVLVGATETTSSGTLWVLYCLAKNPKVQEKLYEETKRVLPNNEAITPEKLSQLHYVKAVIKETFRLYPLTFTTSRYLEEDLEIGGYSLPAGTHVQANLYGMFRDSKFYPDPETFKPERWLKESHMDKELKALSNLVWGHGARMCIGRRFAEQEMHIVLTKIVQNFKIEYNHGTVEPVLNMVMNSDRPLLFSFIPRN